MNVRNFLEIILFSLPRPLAGTERPFTPVPHTARMSAIELALEFQRLLDQGVVNNRAEIARRYGLSRARVTQILNVLQLPQPVLDFLADLPPDSGSFWTERRLRRVLNLPSEAAQLGAVRHMGRQAEAG
jgi:ParB-like chromosome segregation protein Spo0J